MADRRKGVTLNEVLEKAGLTVEWETRGKAIGEVQGKAIGAKIAWGKIIALLKEGYTVDQLERMDPGEVSPSAYKPVQRAKRDP